MIVIVFIAGLLAAHWGVHPVIALVIGVLAACAFG